MSRCTPFPPVLGAVHVAALYFALYMWQPSTWRCTCPVLGAVHVAIQYVMRVSRTYHCTCGCPVHNIADTHPAHNAAHAGAPCLQAREASCTGWPSSPWTSSSLPCRPTASSPPSASTPTSAPPPRWAPFPGPCTQFLLAAFMGGRTSTGVRLSVRLAVPHWAMPVSTRLARWLARLRLPVAGSTID
jgi:hypothetical protein